MDDRTPTPISSLVDRFGWPLPRMAGADGSTDDPADPGDGTPTDPSAQTVDPPALPFSYDDVPETLSGAEAVTWLRAREAQMQSGYTKVVQESRKAQTQAEAALKLQQRLEDDATRREAIAELLSPHGIELEWEDDVDGLTPATDADLDRIVAGSQPDPELVARIDAIEQRNATTDQQSAEQRWIAHTRAGLQAFAEREKVAGGIDKVPESIRQQIVANAMAQPRLDLNGEAVLDMEAGIRLFDVQRAEISRIAREGYIASKDTPTIDLNGAAADPHTDLSTLEGRMAASMKIAQRHH